MISLKELMNPPTEFVNFNLVRNVQNPNNSDSIILAKILRELTIDKLKKVLNYYDAAKDYMIHSKDEDDLILNAIVAKVYFTKYIEDNVHYTLNVVNETMCDERLFHKMGFAAKEHRDTHDRFEHIRKMATQHVLSIKSLDAMLEN